SHSLENVLSLVRGQTLVPSGPVVDRLLKGADLLRRMINDIAHSNNYDVSDHVAALKAVVAGEAPIAALPTGQSPVAGSALQISPDEQSACLAEGKSVFVYSVDPQRDVQARKLVDFVQRLSDTGTILASTRDGEPAAAAAAFAAGDHHPFQLAHATVLTREQVSSFFALPLDQIQPLAMCEPTIVVPVLHDTPARDEHAVHETGPSADELHTDKKHADASIRVSVAVLDRLMNFAGELVLGRNQLLQTIARGDRRSLESVASRINQVTTELQETIMQTRMQPVGNVLNKFNRVIRDMCQMLGKQAQLEIEGKEVELDKSIVESLGDPLMHLIRNSMDHGLEKPDVRVRLGKPAVGTIRLKAMHHEGKVLLVISDDGAGIDAARIRRKAVEKGLITAEIAQALSDREAIQWIFAPGFSTADQVTEISGRGVGMDVVKTNFERLGGTIEIDTKVGEGTTFTVRLPLTLAIIPSLIASCGGQRFAIPQGNIRELVRVGREQRSEMIGTVNRAEVLRLRGDLLPLVHLRELQLGRAPYTQGNNSGVLNIVIVETGRMQYGIVVDALHDSEEIVVKPLGKHLNGITFLAGATVLGDGRIALILDAAGVARRMNLHTSQQTLANHVRDAEETQAAQELIPTLLFANHPHERFGVPMAVVARIERIRTQQIDSVAGQRVLQYRGGTLTLLSLDRCIQARAAPEQDRSYVIVFHHGGREIGLLAPEILDIRNLPAERDTVTFREPGVLGSAVIENHTIRFVDVFDLGNTQPATGRGALRPSATTASERRPQIVFAEDSPFFRNKVKKFLEQEGWDVLACEDGAAAWEAMSSPSCEADLLITDIEMPNMNGFELTERVRNSPRWSHLPVVAVTSLAGDADRAQGVRVGVNEYMVKLNREELLATAARHLGVSLIAD
ncbi:MAG TPA: chemotaxis protein CheW, partial [Planctomycetaceae bacterium]|nr:chemotaxis protein CheW [Planctomycetaceae bacterium]